MVFLMCESTYNNSYFPKVHQQLPPTIIVRNVVRHSKPLGRETHQPVLVVKILVVKQVQGSQRVHLLLERLYEWCLLERWLQLFLAHLAAFLLIHLVIL